MTIDAAVSEAMAGKAPAGWEPYAEHTEQIGSAVVRLPRPGATHRDLLIASGFDPDEWQISGGVNVRRWMRYDQEWLYYYKFDVVAGESPEVLEEHIDDLAAHIRKRRRPAGVPIASGTDAWAYWASDWQIGKREGANGTPQTIDRVLESLDLAEREIKRLRRGGAKMPTGVFFGLGDLVEGTCGFYPNQTYTIDRNRREQNRITRELITHAIDRLRPHFDTLVVGSVPGNHGENRNDGKAHTDSSDNDDIAVFETVKEAFDRAGDSDGIDWVIPDAEIAVLLTLGGVDVGLTHGDKFKGGLAPLSPQKGAVEWWKGQDFGFQEIRGARMLVSAHFHHYSCNTFGVRTAFQTPAMDPGSQWVTNLTGESAPAAVLTMRIDENEPLGFADVNLLSPRQFTA